MYVDREEGVGDCSGECNDRMEISSEKDDGASIGIGREKGDGVSERDRDEAGEDTASSRGIKEEISDHVGEDGGGEGEGDGVSAIGQGRA